MRLFKVLGVTTAAAAAAFGLVSRASATAWQAVTLASVDGDYRVSAVANAFSDRIRTRR
ncbi:hypothetical protein [Streptomyces sp. CB02400]|uniref:hypothetical protein n=1 Tax=Streptomyces sp. CB02400 TaxID=1703944 RepID=UPI00130194A3|nr:hypothetical protein [Streptomyces sp. CB02400]